MATIKVEKNEELKAYGDSIKSFSDNYALAAADTRRSFAYKTEASEGKAIAVFLERLNTIQTTLFDTYPDHLNQASEAYLTYSSAISGLGFVNRAWSSDTGVGSVATILQGSQITTLDDTATSLQTSLDTATDLLGIDTVDVKAEAETAGTTLEDSAKKRKDTIDSGMQAGYSAFTEGLKSAESALKELQTSLDTARLSLSIPVSAVVNAIKLGFLTEDNINTTLDLAQSKEDAAVLKAVFQDKPENIAAVDPDKVSDGVMTVVFGYFFDDITYPSEGGERVKQERLTIFIDTLYSKYTGIHSETKNGKTITKDYSDYITRYSEKLLMAGDRYAVVTIASLLANYPTFPRLEDYSNDAAGYAKAVAEFESQLSAYNNDTETLQAYKDTFKKINSLNGVFQTLAVSGLDRWVSNSQGYYSSYPKENQLLFRLSKEGLTFDKQGNSNFTLEGYQKPPGENRPEKLYSYKVSSTIIPTSQDLDLYQDNEASRKLEKKRSAAVANFVADIAQVGLTAANPAVGLSIGFIRSMAGSSSSSKAGAVKDVASANVTEAFKDKVKFAGSLVQSAFKLQENLSSMDAEKQKKMMERYEDLFELGGIKVSGELDGTRQDFYKVSTNNYYSLETILRQFDFEQNGLRRYIHHANVQEMIANDKAVTDQSVYIEARNDLERLKEKLYDDSYQAAIGGQVKVEEVDIVKFFDEMIGEDKIPVKKEDAWWNPFDGNGSGTMPSKTGKDVFDAIGGSKGDYTDWIDDTFEVYRTTSTK